MEKFAKESIGLQNESAACMTYRDLVEECRERPNRQYLARAGKNKYRGVTLQTEIYLRPMY